MQDLGRDNVAASLSRIGLHLPVLSHGAWGRKAGAGNRWPLLPGIIALADLFSLILSEQNL
jgi:hypothetical protein